MRRTACAAVVLLCLPGCVVGRLDLPADPVQITLIQRHSRSLPGSNGTVRLNIGDITGGQVLMSIHGPGTKTIVDTCSVWPGKVVPFEVGRTTYYLGVIQLRNFAVGDDFGVFEITTMPPVASAETTE